METAIKVDSQLAELFQLAVCAAGETQEQVLDRLLRQYIAQVVRDRTENTRTRPAEGSAKARRKLELWSRRPDQICSRVLGAFFACEEQGRAQQSEMARRFVERTGLTVGQFESNLSSMCTEKGKSHGHVFDRSSGVVRLAPEIEAYARELREQFLY